MSKINCVFCKEHNDKAKEHIIPVWLQKEIFGNVNWDFQGIHYSSFYLKIKNIRQHTGDNLLFGKVCKFCNNGWMSDLEEQFIPIFRKLISVNNYNLTNKEKFILSLWSFKTAIIINAGSNYRKKVPSHLYNNLYKYRNLPKNIKVDLAYVKNDSEFNWIQSQIMFHIGGNNIPKNENFIITIQLKNIAIRVSWLENAKEENRTIKFKYIDKTKRIWPLQSNIKYIKNSFFIDLENFAEDIYTTNM